VPGAAPTAWFFPGASAEHWVEELGRCGLAEANTRLFVVPRSTTERSAAGLLVLPPPGLAPKETPAGVACRSTGRLFLPLDGVLHPPITETEAQALFPLPVNFIHPTLGLTAFEEEATRRVWDLLEPPEECVEQWNRARAGAAPLPELSGVLLTSPPSLQDIFGDAPNEIGSASPRSLPPSLGEPKDTASAESGRKLKEWFLHSLSGALRSLPHKGARQTWVNHLERWTKDKLSGLGEQLEQLRNKELNRLLKLLESDPEAGLRHAIPLNQLPHRGLAPPGARLGSRTPDFNAARLGGRAADFWEISPDLREVLQRRYREMADREMQLGRHRRAAFIYAELLGDLLSAARALKQGRFFREAALLYEERLQNPLEGARCFAEAGLLQEAIERYEKLGKWLEAAELYERLGKPDLAAAAIQREINERLVQGDLLGAARLQDERLHQPEEALELLLGGWAASRQAAGCFSAALRLFARLALHQRALENLVRLRRSPLSRALLHPLLTALAEPAQTYPHASVRHEAADLTRALVSRELIRKELQGADAGALLEHLIRLTPSDPLVARDANRYLSDLRARQLRVQRVSPPPLPGKRPELRRRIELPRQIEWLALRTEWHWFYALGITPNRVTLLRGIWEGEFQSLSWAGPEGQVRRGLIFEPTAQRGEAVALATSSGLTFNPKRFPAADLFYGRECIAGTPEWLRPNGFPFAFGDETVWSAHVANERAILSSHTKQGQLLKTTDLTRELLENMEEMPATALCLLALPDGAAIALGSRLLIVRAAEIVSLDLPGAALRLVPTLLHTRPGVAILSEHGACMHWLGSEQIIELERDIPNPSAAFVPGGPLVIASDKRLILLDVDGHGVKSVTRMELPRSAVAVSGTASPGQFAVLSANGELQIFRF